jgi:hypothetical protein
MKPYQEESLDREADPNGLLLQPTFGKAVGRQSASSEVARRRRPTGLCRPAP